MKRLLTIGMTTLCMACQMQQAQQDFCFDEMTYSPSETVFKLFAPRGAQCSVVLGRDTLPMTLHLRAYASIYRSSKHASCL